MRVWLSNIGKHFATRGGDVKERGGIFPPLHFKTQILRKKSIGHLLVSSLQLTLPLTGSRSAEEKWHLSGTAYQTSSFGKQTTLCFASAHA